MSWKTALPHSESEDKDLDEGEEAGEGEGACCTTTVVRASPNWAPEGEVATANTLPSTQE